MNQLKQKLKLSQKPNRTTNSHPAFTLVELLIVIVVIAILAAISIIAYSGIQTRATETILKSDLKNAATRLGIIKTEDGNYPSGNSTPSQIDSVKSEGTKFQYTGTDGTSYCLTATSEKNSKAKAFHIKDGAAAKDGVCPGSGHTGPNPGGSGNGNGSGGGTVTNGDPIQSLTSSQCSSMDIYDGSNPSAILTLKDSRGGTERDYEVAKLADGNCWMLTNLKLGSSSPITLTPGDSDVTSNFILPALTTGSSISYVNPMVYGPVPGDTGSGATNYGYLYNWSAVTAGETNTTMPAGSGDALYSICPAGWKLPSGGRVAGASDFSRLDQAFGGTGGYQTGTLPHLDTGWLYSGAFKSVYAGIGGGVGSFIYQGVDNHLWSRSADPGNGNYAIRAGFSDNYVNPGGNYDRYVGHGVRCLLN